MTVDLPSFALGVLATLVVFFLPGDEAVPPFRYKWTFFKTRIGARRQVSRLLESFAPGMVVVVSMNRRSGRAPRCEIRGAFPSRGVPDVTGPLISAAEAEREFGAGVAQCVYVWAHRKKLFAAGIDAAGRPLYRRADVERLVARRHTKRRVSGDVHSRL